MKKMEVGVIGLGKFGFQVATTLTELGHRVVGLDSSASKVRHADPILAMVYQGDATDKAVLEQLRFQDFDCVVLSVGQSMEASILVTLNLIELQVRQVVSKAISPEHRRVLRRLGVHRVIQPEVDVAIQTAHQLHNPGMLDLLPLGGGVLLQEVIIKDWTGKNLAELNITNQLGIMAVARKNYGHKEFSFVPDPQKPLQKGDALILIGKPEVIQSLTT